MDIDHINEYLLVSFCIKQLKFNCNIFIFNEAKSVQVTFTTRRKTCPPVILDGVSIPQAESARYLGLHLDRRLNWRRHISTKQKQLGIQLRKMYWMLGNKSQLSIENKLLLYKAILKPIWTYGVRNW